MQANHITPQMKAAVSLFHRRYAKAMLLAHDEASIQMLEQIREYFIHNINTNPLGFNEYCQNHIAQINAELKNGAEPMGDAFRLFRLLDQFYLMAKEGAQMEVAAILSPEPTSRVINRVIDEAARALAQVFQDREHGLALVKAITENPLVSKHIFERIGNTYAMRTSADGDEALKRKLYTGDRTGMRGQLSTAVAHDGQALQNKANAEEHLKTVAGAIQSEGKEEELVAAAGEFTGTILVHIFGEGDPKITDEMTSAFRRVAPNARRVHGLIYHGTQVGEVRDFIIATMHEGETTFLKEELESGTSQILNFIVHPYVVGGQHSVQAREAFAYSVAIQNAIHEVGGYVYHTGMNEVSDLSLLTQAVGAAASVKKYDTEQAKAGQESPVAGFKGTIALHFVCGIDSSNMKILNQVQDLMPDARVLDYHYMNDRNRAMAITQSAIATANVSGEGENREVAHLLVGSSNSDLGITEMILKLVRSTGALALRVKEETLLDKDNAIAALEMIVGEARASLASTPTIDDPEKDAVVQEAKQVIGRYTGAVMLHFVGEADPSNIAAKKKLFTDALGEGRVFSIDYYGTAIADSHKLLMKELEAFAEDRAKFTVVTHFVIAPDGVTILDTLVRNYDTTIMTGDPIHNSEAYAKGRYVKAVVTGLRNLDVFPFVLDNQRLREGKMFLGSLAASFRGTDFLVARDPRLHVTKAEVGGYSNVPKSNNGSKADYAPNVAPKYQRENFTGTLIAHAVNMKDPDALQIFQTMLEAAVPKGRVIVISYGGTTDNELNARFVGKMEKLAGTDLRGEQELVHLVLWSDSDSNGQRFDRVEAIKDAIAKYGAHYKVVRVGSVMSTEVLFADVASAIANDVTHFSGDPVEKTKHFGVLSSIPQGTGGRNMPDRSQGEAEISSGRLVDYPATAEEAAVQGRAVRELMQKDSLDLGQSFDLRDGKVVFDGTVVLHTLSDDDIEKMNERVQAISKGLTNARLFTISYDNIGTEHLADAVGQNINYSHAAWKGVNEQLPVVHILLTTGVLDQQALELGATMRDIRLKNILVGMHKYNPMGSIFDDEDFVSKEAVVDALKQSLSVHVEKVDSRDEGVNDFDSSGKPVNPRSLGEVERREPDPEQAAQMAEAISDSRQAAREHRFFDNPSSQLTLRKEPLRMEELSAEDRARLEADPKLKSIMEHHENIRENVIAVTEQYLSSLPEEERRLIASMLGDNVVMSDAVQQMIDRGIIPQDAQ